MRRRILVLAALTLASSGCQTLSSGSSVSEEQSTAEFRTDEEFRSWFAFYYKAPHPEMLTAALKFMQAHKYLDDYPDIASVFLSHVMATDPQAMTNWVEHDWQSLGDAQWSVILVSLWMVHTDVSEALLRKYVDRADPKHHDRIKTLLSHDPGDIDPLRAAVVDPRQINLIWAAFSATGDERYVRKVVDYVHLYGENGNDNQALIGEAAIMTLANNALQHEVVAKLCNDLDNTHPDAKTRLLLQAMLNALAQMTQEGQAGDTAH